MAAGFKARISFALIALAASSGLAAAQTYDGNGLLRFGVFGQSTNLHYNETSPGNASATPSGFAGGVSFGYDYIFGQRFVLGAEFDGSFSDIRGDVAGTPSTSYGSDYLITGRGRMGYYVHPNWLVYGTAGAAWYGFEAQSAVTGDKHTATLTGWTYGGGTEIDWRSIVFFAEYLHTDFGGVTFGLNATEHRVDMDADLVRVGVKFKIGQDFNRDVGIYYDPMK
jgi:opacity protein-like surface antigen